MIDKLKPAPYEGREAFLGVELAATYSLKFLCSVYPLEKNLMAFVYEEKSPF